jgi:hypothetical protein
VKQVTILGNPGRSLHEFHETIEHRFKRSGLNTGNNMFWYAVDNHISSPKSFVGWHANPKIINETSDCLVIVAANWIYEANDLTQIANIIEKTTVPVVVVGLGVQAPNASHKLVLKPGTQRFVDLLRDKGVYVCCRGAATAAWLETQGVQNLLVTGCPSNFINPKLNLGRIVEQKFKTVSENVVVSVEASPSHAKWNDKLFSLVNNRNWLGILQDPLNVLEVLNGNVAFEGGMDRIQQSALPMPPEGTSPKSWFINRYKAFYDAEAWMDDLQRYDLQVGTKLHGSMACFQAEVPSIFVTHDLRTQELAEAMCVPAITRDKMMSANSLEELVDVAGFDGAVYDENRRQRARTYATMLSSLGLQISKSLQEMSTPDPVIATAVVDPGIPIIAAEGAVTG